MLAWLGIFVLSPLLVSLIAIVRATSKGPALLWQERVGLNGQAFQIVKLRSMYEDAEQWTGAVWASEDDPRVTPVGWYLRKLHLDELPQLWNVAKGEMSFIGPRPERPEFVDEFIEQIPGYEGRLAVLPGVTGLAQVNLPPDQTSDCVRRKIELDLEYIFTAEPTLDLRIALCTVLKMLAVPREWSAKFMYIFREPSTFPSPQAIPQPAATLFLSDKGKINNPLADAGSPKHTWRNSSSLTMQG